MLKFCHFASYMFIWFHKRTAKLHVTAWKYLGDIVLGEIGQSQYRCVIPSVQGIWGSQVLRKNGG